MNEQAPTLLTVRILWVALLISQGIYVGVLVGGLAEPPAEPPDPMMLTALSAVAMFNAMASIFLPRFLQRGALAKDGSLGELRDQPPDAFLGRAIQKGLPAFIIGLALAESVAIFGLILGLLGFALLTVAPFFAAGATLMLVQFPTEGRFRGPIEEALAARR